MRRFFSILILVLFAQFARAQTWTITGKLSNPKGRGIADAELLFNASSTRIYTDSSGSFSWNKASGKQVQVIVFAYGYKTDTLIIQSSKAKNIRIVMLPMNSALPEATIKGRQKAGMNYKIRDIHRMGIYASKKTEVIQINPKVANLATNNPRQIYAQVPGLNIWENDGAGLQLSIGARGLSPNRTSNFNTRQNGYDISADALGYPESYYVPPAMALKTIEIVRGAASLQYGPQFGGLLNFIFKDGDIEEKLKLTVDNTIGSFGFWNAFISAEGKQDSKKYYAFYQRRQGDGWRDNSNFDQNTAYGAITFPLGKKLTAKVDFTHMDYLAQQPGGLQDFEFDQTPQLSKRSRNWFNVNWNLAAINLDYTISKNLRSNIRAFVLDASRMAVGELGPINRPDPLRERDLVSGTYQNWAVEGRMMKRFQWLDRSHVVLWGFRYYHGLTHNQQGNASNGNHADFNFLNPDDLEKSSYEFPSKNISLFAENMFRINSKWTITPGLRYEIIRTQSEGFYKNRVFSGGELIFEQRKEDNRSLNRALLLGGVGTSYRLKKRLEWYFNASQNYRSVNFSDLSISNPNLLIDSNLTDESGYNIDMGLRGKIAKGHVVFDLSIFHLRYNNRIGITEIIVDDKMLGQKAVTYRTNVGDAENTGLELYAKTIWDVGQIKGKPLQFQAFVNNSIIHGLYLSGNSSIIGNRVEYIPLINSRTGITLKYKTWYISYLVSYVSDQYSDATNAEFVSDATRGIIPAYLVQDFNAGFNKGPFGLKISINNLANSNYFTRRALMYPGPGIIPADKRSIFINLSYQLIRK